MQSTLPISLFIFIFSFFILNSSCQPQEFFVGSYAPEFKNIQWLQSPKLKLSDLKGKVVLMRWWTDECILCINSSDALNEWHVMYADSGLVIIGLYHPKPQPKICNVEDVKVFVLEKGFQFPIAIDDQWLNLKKFWLDAKQRDFTSVSFLIDQKGIIRYIHPGGEYHKELSQGHEKCVEDYDVMQRKIVELIRSK